jgi:flagellar biosynthesis protein FlhG
MRIVSITSGKGGVGKTNMAANLGIALSQLGNRVVLFDADLGLANLDVILGTSAEYSLHHAIDGNLCLSEVIANGPGGIRFLSGGAGVSKLINISKKRLQNFLQEFAQLESTTDFLIFDTGAGVDGRVMTFLRAAHEVVVVVTPDPASIADAYATMKVLLRLKPEANIKVLMNQVDCERQAEAVYRKLNDIAGHFLDANLSYLGSVRHDAEIGQWIRLRQPFVLAEPRLNASKDVVALAKKLGHQAEIYDIGDQLLARLGSAFGTEAEVIELPRAA